MRILFKIIAMPFVVALSVLWAVLVFLFGVISGLLEIVCGLSVLVSIALFIMQNWTGGIVFMVVAFLISPLGLPLIADWLIELVACLNDALKGFITT